MVKVVVGCLVAAMLGFLGVGGASASVTPSSVITTVAGKGQVAGFAGDGGPASAALLNMPRDSELGPDGSIYVADTDNNRIRRIAPDGTITTVAGNGVEGYNGDGIPATSAALWWPHDVFVDDVGNLFIVDSHNNRIREVTSDGIIRTIVGTGASGSSGDGGLATRARIKQPKSAYLFNGFLYFTSLENKVRRVDMATGIISTYAGTGTAGYRNGARLTAQFRTPQRIQLDSLGNVFVADTENHAIRRIDAATGLVTTVAGTGVRGYNGSAGTATTLRLNNPRGIALDGDGLLYIADTGNNRIRQVDLATGYLTTVAGTGAQGFSGDGGPAISARFYQVRGLTVDGSGNLLVADSFNSVLRRIAHS